MGSWFEVDRDGLAKLLRRKGLAFALYELVQNAWDTNTKRVLVELTPVPGRPAAVLRVTDDDPEGFKNLSHAYTLFAASDKKANPTKRGRFNLGEKLVLAICEEAQVRSTRGTIRFGQDGRTSSSKEGDRLERGSVFTGTIRMTRAEYEEVCASVRLLIPPPGIETTFNGEVLSSHEPLRTFTASLPTEIADEEGYLKRTTRMTQIRIHAPVDGVSRIYEMGIPVVETDLPWSVEILQKIPLNADRDNVTPAYARELSVLVMNEMHTLLQPEQATLPAVQEALGDDRIAASVVEAVLRHQYGEKRAIFDPSDLEANRRLVAEGYTVIPGGSFSKTAWKNIRAAGAAVPAGALSPTPKPYSSDPEARDARYVAETNWTNGMKLMAEYAHELAWRLISRSITVHFERGRMTDGWVANYGNESLTFNHDRLGRAWFDQGSSEAMNDLLIHELSHEYGGHLTDEFDHALSRLGAKMVSLALREPAFFKKYEAK